MKKLYSLLVGLIITASLNIAAVSYADNNILSPIKPVAATTCTTAQVISVKPLEVVKNPEKFLNITRKGDFEMKEQKPKAI